MQARFGLGAGALVLLGIPMITTFNSTVLSLATNTKVGHSESSRDDSVEKHSPWTRVNNQSMLL